MRTYFQAAKARRTEAEVEAAFAEGFYRVRFAECDKLGEYGVKARLSECGYPEMKYTAAIEWIKRNAQAATSAANTRNNVTQAVEIASVLIALVALVVAIFKH